MITQARKGEGAECAYLNVFRLDKCRSGDCVLADTVPDKRVLTFFFLIQGLQVAKEGIGIEKH